jgi:hypothetical protein
MEQSQLLVRRIAMADGNVPLPPASDHAPFPTNADTSPKALRAMVPQANRGPWRRSLRLLFFLGGLACVALACFAVGSSEVTVCLAAGTACAAAGALTAIFDFGNAGREEATVASRVWIAFTGVVFAGAALLGGLATIVSTMRFSRGRQLRRFGKVLLPPVGPGAGWIGKVESTTVPAELRGEVAAQWRENGRTEHASVAAFARLTLDLIALGAPAKLIADAQRDALDEVHHAELCFGLARALDGEDRVPTAFPEALTARTLPASRIFALCTLAVHSLVDGALHEGVSARIVARLATGTDDPTIRDMLKTIARDEGRHSAHGWDVVLWCVEQGGDIVIAALRGAVDKLPLGMQSELPAPARDGSWERFGIMGHTVEREEYEKTRAHITRRVFALWKRGPSGAWTNPRRNADAAA